jgi:hypothetical protein
MSDSELIELTGNQDSVRVTVTTIEIPARVASNLTATDGVLGVIVRRVSGDAVRRELVGRPQPVRADLRRWSPFRPFTGMLTNYRLAREALGRSGKVGIIYICIGAGLASIIWRHASILIGIGGGLLVSGILFIRTGAYREYLDAIKDTHGVPPLDVVLRYNVEYLLHRIRALWRR